jgi:uncharacterized membrane protein
VSSERRRELADIALLALLAGAAVAVAADLQPVRPFLVFTAACVVPGGAVMTKLGTGEGLTDLALAFGLSFAIEAACAVLLAWSGWWHPIVLGAALGSGAAFLLIADLTARRG